MVCGSTVDPVKMLLCMHVYVPVRVRMYKAHAYMHTRQVCGSVHDSAKMLMCDGCDVGCHIFCLVPKMQAVPDEDVEWFCHRLKCQVGSRTPSSLAPQMPGGRNAPDVG